MQLDRHHAFACTECHGGNAAESGNKDLAHTSLIAQPAHPNHMQASCGRCHPAQVASASNSSHFTLANKINSIRAHFGSNDKPTRPEAVPISTSANAITTEKVLSDDMLRRSCLRCHVYSKGDSYSAVRHGSGCAACHLAFTDGKPVDHRFQLPNDKNCLSCHYGNYVGNDYYGRYEHDLPYEYRTPYTASTETGFPPRPYGVEYHDLVPDIHQQRGMVCRDCHQGFVHGAAKQTVTCRTCHDWKPAENSPALGNVRVREGKLLLTGLADGKEHLVPQMQHPAHQEFGQRADCQVCHAQWSYNDTTTHLLLSYDDDYDPWFWLTVQGSSEVEKRLEDGLYSYQAEEGPAMRDGLSGEVRPGMWYKGYTERRWERMLIGKDSSGMLRVLRPVLDLRLSMADEDGEPRFDNVRGKDDGLRPYTPHTTGPAGLFYRDRLQGLSSP
ncbi:MAG: hypothetical protein Q4G66_12375 [bacterium]|nr:hypothetical protein [bacterium]